MFNRLLQPTTNILNHTNDLRKAAKNVADDLHAEASNKIGPLRELAQDHMSTVRGRAGHSWQSMKSAAKEHPFAAVGLGIFAGLLLAGWALRRSATQS